MLPPGRCSRQGSRGPLACYGWCRALLDAPTADKSRPGGRVSHNERADWPILVPMRKRTVDPKRCAGGVLFADIGIMSQSRGRAVGTQSQSPSVMDAVAATIGVSGEVSFVVAAGDQHAVRAEHAPVFQEVFWFL